jgi:hypothetical protein
MSEEMTFEAMIHALTNGVPGSVNALVSVVKDYRQIDPSSGMGFVGYFITLDMFMIHDQDIFKVYSSCCEDAAKFLAVIRGLQLGFISESQVKTVIGHYEVTSFDFVELVKQIRVKLPDFDPNNLIGE